MEILTERYQTPLVFLLFLLFLFTYISGFHSFLCHSLSLNEWTLNLKDSFTVCKLLNSQFESPGQLFFQTFFQTCWTWSVWDIQRSCAKLNWFPIVLLKSKLCLSEGHYCSALRLSTNLLPSLPWKKTMPFGEQIGCVAGRWVSSR